MPPRARPVTPSPRSAPSVRTPDVILRERAAALARPLGAAEESTGAGKSCAICDIAGQMFAIEATYVREAVLVSQITPLPGLPPFVSGLANVRSQILPAFDPRSLLGLPRRTETRGKETLLVTSFDDAELGLLIDAVAGSRTLDFSSLRSRVPGLQERFLHGIAADGTIVLDYRALAAALARGDATG